MIVIDITETDFIQLLDVEEANNWMSDNIGDIVMEEWDHCSGVGWQIWVDPPTQKWFLKLDSEAKALLFLLRWS